MNNTWMLRATLAAAVFVATQGAAWAQAKGDLLFRVGQMTIIPQVNSGDLSTPSPAHTQIDVGRATTLAGGITYMVTDNFSVDLPLAVPFKHHIYGAGAISGSGEIGTTKVVPATLFFQYRFNEPTSKWRPFLGIGPTYAKFISETGNGTLTGLTNPGSTPTTLSIANAWGYTVQAGLSYAVTPHVYLEAMVGQTYLKTTTTLSTGQTIDTHLNPVIASWCVGYRF